MTHGTATGWRYHGCRCSACHRALLAEGKVTWAARRLRAGAEPATRVRADRVRQHIAELIAAGWTQDRIAKAALVSPATVSVLRQPSTKRCSRIVAASILAVS